jgi:D-psicose/D-tagatose/L-ribulose 3-epimerase
MIGIISMFYVRPFLTEHLALLPRMKEAGCDFVELLVPEPGELDLKQARAAAAKAGLGVVLAARINPARDVASADRATHEAGIAYLEACVDSAVALGATIVGGPIYGAPLVFAGRAPAPVAEEERLARVARVVAALQQAGAYAEKHGVKLAIEPLNRFETDMCSTTRQGLDLIARVGSPAIGLMLDTFHMNMEEDDIAGAIRSAGRAMIHFQANENHRGFIGTGHVDWRAVARALAAIGYDGPITLEPFRRDEHRLGVPLAQWRAPAADETAALARSVGLLRATLESVRRAA